MISAPVLVFVTLSTFIIANTDACIAHPQGSLRVILCSFRILHNTFNLCKRYVLAPQHLVALEKTFHCVVLLQFREFNSKVKVLSSLCKCNQGADALLAPTNDAPTVSTGRPGRWGGTITTTTTLFPSYRLQRARRYMQRARS